MQATRKRIAAFIGILLVAGAAQSAQAVSLHPGGTATYNFDLTGQASAPPYTSFTFSHFGFADNDPLNDRVTYEIFSELNGGGTRLVLLDNFQVLDQQSLFNASPETLDGVYSIRLTDVIGEYDIVTASAQAFSGSIQPVAEILGVLSVPEPTSLALLGSMLALAAFRRRI